MHCEHWTWTWETLRIASPYWPHSLAPFIAFATGQSPKNDTSGTSIRRRLRATSIGSPAVYRTTSLRPLLTHIYVLSGLYIICYNCHSSLHTSLNARHTHRHTLNTHAIRRMQRMLLCFSLNWSRNCTIVEHFSQVTRPKAVAAVVPSADCLP